jgi:3-hydroxy-9,10-secoandrosta-1,3,5(10)-triene-9,17-dione monooxygenase reductase component
LTQGRHSSIDQGEYRTVLGHFASGVVVVTAIHEERPAGLTCQSFFSLSLDPPLVAFAPGRGSTSWPKVSAAGNLCINVLGSEQEALARTFANSGVDKFDGVGWTPAANGAPRLDGSLAWIDCNVEQSYEAGDHYLVVARVEGIETGHGHPLIFYRGGFGGFES